MIGYAFMGAAHAQAWRNAPRFFDVPLRLELSAVAGRNADAVRAADHNYRYAPRAPAWVRLRMSLHSWQMASGITPILIRLAKIAQPRHTAKTASSVAAAARHPARRKRPRTGEIRMPTPRRSPTGPRRYPARNAFGGPGTGLAATPSSGVTTRVTSWPSGLNVGPVRTRATKP
jgi:hypothetical protein